MSKPRPFLNTPYGAYFAREVPPPDDELVRVGPGTPCGEYLRSFWQPVAFARDLRDVPLRIRIMSEDLVTFRDKRGTVGLLQLNCAHRGTSLEYGLISERGIRCCYHGWVYDVDGRILETPGEPASSTLKDRLCQGAYPVHEFAGLIFAYMGPPE
jgi:phenylpropionate dioxygenase-like ring-hydroxylating dioxygenase large terminal subunit